MENMCLNTLHFISFFSECHRLRAAVQVRMWCKLFSMNARRWANSSFLPVLTSAVSPGFRCWNADIGFWEIKQVCTTPPHHAGGSHFLQGKGREVSGTGPAPPPEAALRDQCKLPSYCLPHKSIAGGLCKSLAFEALRAAAPKLSVSTQRGKPVCKVTEQGCRCEISAAIGSEAALASL